MLSTYSAYPIYFGLWGRVEGDVDIGMIGVLSRYILGEMKGKEETREWC